MLRGAPGLRLGGELRLRPRRRHLLGLRRRKRGLPHLGEKADLGPSLGETHHIAISEVGLLDSLPVDKSPIGALVDHPKAVSLPEDCCVLARHYGEIDRETEMAGRLPTDDDFRFGKFLDLSLQGTLNVNKLHDDCWWTLHD